MLNWIRERKLRFWKLVEPKKPESPKCSICMLGASYWMQIQFQRIDLEPIADKILILICNGCYEDTYEKYNPERNPSPIIYGVFDNKEE